MRCPGQDTQYWKEDAIYEVPCPNCRKQVEFFKDDSARKCEHCGHRFPNPRMDFGCAAYCKFAEQCIGDLKPELVAQRKAFLKDKVAVAMKRYFKTDFKRIGHATRVARYAERIARDVAGGDLAVILSAAYLHDIGIHAAEQKHGSTGARFQEMEGPPIARGILTDLGATPDLIEEVCDIVGHHHHPREEETPNFKVVFDADQIENLAEANQKKPMDPDALDRIIERRFLTESGRAEARAVLLPES